MKRKRTRQKLKTSSIIIGFITALSVFAAFGIVSVLIPNGIFVRMTSVYLYDYIFLVLTSVLMGIYIGLWYYTKKTKAKCNYAATGGAIGGFLSFGCAICNKLLILLLGVTGVLTYFTPLQPILGIVSVILLTYAIYMQYKVLVRQRK